MTRATTARVAMGTPLLAAAIWIATTAAAPAAKPPVALDCAAWISDSVPNVRDRAEVTARYAEPIGQNLTATFADSAKIDVISTTRQASGEPMSARLVLNTARAVTGKWKLTLVGETGSCAGIVYVGVKK